MTELKQLGFGAALRQRREELKLSLDDLAASTRIRKTYLQALEEENLSALPGAAYTIGFLRIYARQLGLAIEPLLSSLNGNTGSEDRVDLLSTGGELSRPSKKKPKKRKAGRLLILLIILLAVAGAYVYFRRGPAAPPQPAVVLAPAESPPPVVAAPPPPEVDPPAPAPQPGEAAAVELQVLPPEGAVVRMLPIAVGVMKVSLDNQELREYQLQPDQSLNWKVAGSLACELSVPGLVRVWVDQREVAVAEYPAFVLKGIAPQERRP